LFYTEVNASFLQFVVMQAHPLVNIKPTTFLKMTPILHQFPIVFALLCLLHVLFMLRIEPAAPNLHTFWKIAVVFATCASGNLNLNF
jgi:hypothetical protein